ncbi:helix-turn-helix domain-containing protein, partial [Faecalimonas sp.]
EYLRTVRMDKAKELLMNTTIPINLVAQEVGYQNQGSFAERFRMETGMTPSEYRNHCMNKSLSSHSAIS